MEQDPTVSIVVMGVQGVGKTKHTLREWNRHPWAVMRSWVLGADMVSAMGWRDWIRRR